MKRTFFQKHSIGFAVLISGRDWAIFLAIFSGAMALGAGMAAWSGIDLEFLKAAAIGGWLGMLPSVLMCLPVNGVVDELSHDALRAFLKSMKFARCEARDGALLYTHDTPTWMRWDSNRVTVRRLPNGNFEVSMPLYCYRFYRRLG